MIVTTFYHVTKKLKVVKLFLSDKGNINLKANMMKGRDMMTAFDVRDLVLKNLSGSSREEVEGYIQETIDTREEDALPGMGILFEVVWQKSSREDKSSMMDKIMEGINKQPI